MPKKETQTRFLIKLIFIIVAFGLVGCNGADENVQFVAEWGGEGPGEGQFLFIEDFDFDANGNLVATDALKKDVQIFSRDGDLVAIFGTTESGEASISLIMGELFKEFGVRERNSFFARNNI